MQSADALASLFSELALWARAMPPYADSLCGVAAAALSVLDDRCAALFDGVMQQEPALATLFERRGIAAQIGAETIIRFVEREELFEDPFRESESRASDAILRTVLMATDPGTPSKPQVRYAAPYSDGTVRSVQYAAGGWIFTAFIHCFRLSSAKGNLSLRSVLSSAILALARAVRWRAVLQFRRFGSGLSYTWRP